MSNPIFRNLALSVTSALLLVACGGGNGTPADGGVDHSATGGSGGVAGKTGQGGHGGQAGGGGGVAGTGNAGSGGSNGSGGAGGGGGTANGGAGGSSATGTGGSAGGAGTGGSSTGGTGGAAGAAGGGGSGGSQHADAGTDAAAACNAINNGALLINEMNVATAAPTASGGTVQNGTYFQTLSSVYTGPGGTVGADGHTEQQTLVISGATASTATIQAVDSSDGKAAGRGTFTAAISGTSLVLTTTCPAGSQNPKVYDFSVSTDGTVFTLVHTGTQASSQTFTKQ